MGMDGAGRITSFVEKPADPPPMPGQPDLSLASMGIYVFNTDVMYEQLFQDAARKEASSHDFGKDIIPAMMAAGMRIFAYPFRDENRKTAAYWRDVGTLDAYFQTSMDLISIDPILNLYDQDWPIHTYQPPYPPPKFVHTDPDRRGAAFNSIVCQGAIVSGGQVFRSIISPDVRVNSYALVEDSILLDGVDVGRRARVRRAIIDKDVKIPAGFEIGWNRELDLAPRPDHHPRRPHRRRQGRRSGAVCVMVPKVDPFWRRMQAIWDAQKACGHVPRSAEEIDAQQREMREGSAKRQEAIEQLQKESRRLRHAEPGSQS